VVIYRSGPRTNLLMYWNAPCTKMDIMRWSGPCTIKNVPIWLCTEMNMYRYGRKPIWRRMEKISWKDKKTNEEILNTISHRRQIWMGHVLWHEGILHSVFCSAHLLYSGPMQQQQQQQQKARTTTPSSHCAGCPELRPIHQSKFGIW